MKRLEVEHNDEVLRSLPPPVGFSAFNCTAKGGSCTSVCLAAACHAAVGVGARSSLQRRTCTVAWDSVFFSSGSVHFP